jgi:hypothetical protein
MTEAQALWARYRNAVEQSRRIGLANHSPVLAEPHYEDLYRLAEGTYAGPDAAVRLAAIKRPISRRRVLKRHRVVRRSQSWRIADCEACNGVLATFSAPSAR